MACCPGAESVTPPMLHAGIRLPESAIQEAGQILEQVGLMPEKGYLGVTVS
ncbi:MAG: hypothetical protein ABII06_14015 [Pseudomonadota bacterium]